MAEADGAAEAPSSTREAEADVHIHAELAPVQTAVEQQGSDAQRCQAEDGEGEDRGALEDHRLSNDIGDEEGDHCCLCREGENGEIEPTPVQEEFECRICQQPSELDELWAPCRCTGTMKFVHPACLQAWRQRGSRDAVRCGVCLAPYEGARELSWAGAGPIYVLTRLREAFSSMRQPPIRRHGLQSAVRVLAGLALGKEASCRTLRLAFWSILFLLAAACSRPVLLTVSAFHELVMGVDRAVDPIIFPEQPLDALYRFFPAIGGFGHLGVYEATASLAEALAAVAYSGAWASCSAIDASTSGAVDTFVAAADEGSSFCSASAGAHSSAAASAIVSMAGNASSVVAVGTSAGVGSVAATVDSAAAGMACTLAGNATAAAASGGTTTGGAAAVLAAWARVSFADVPKVAAEAAAPWLRPFQEAIGQALDQREPIWRMPASFDDAALGGFLMLLLVHLGLCVFPDSITDFLRRVPSPIEDAMALLQGGVPGPDHAVAFILLSVPWAAYSARWLLAAVGVLRMEDLPFHEHAALHLLLGLIVIAMYSLVCDLCEVVHQDFSQWYAEFTLGSQSHPTGDQRRPDAERLDVPPGGL